MKISFLVNYIAGGWKPTDTRLGGTERGVVEWTEELRSRGHEVIIYDNDNRDSYNGGEDVCINVKSSDIAPKVPTIYYTNEVDADKKDLSMYDAVIHISQWAKDNVPVNNKNVFIVPHGYDPEKIYPERKIKRQCLYSSSPDRRLDTLLRAWLKVYPHYPDATLLVTYGAEGPEIPGVTYLGDTTEDQMNELYRQSDIWCHPCNGGEMQCIAGLKAQAAGCWPVVIPVMALAETIKYGTFTTEENYAEALDHALEFHPRHTYQGITIKESTDKLLEVVEYVYGRHR